MRAILRGTIGLGLLVVGVACGGGSESGTPPADVNTIAKNAGDGQTATVGEATPVAPSVRVTNQNQAPVPNIAVIFAVASGGGQVTGGATTTNASGIATVGGWTMGTVTGTNTLTASSTGINGSPLTFTVTANAGPAKTITKQSGDNQTASVLRKQPRKVGLVDRFVDGRPEQRACERTAMVIRDVEGMYPERSGCRRKSGCGRTARPVQHGRPAHRRDGAGVPGHHHSG